MQNTLSRNMERLEELYDLAIENGIPIDESCPEKIISMSVRLPNGMKIVSLSKEQPQFTHIESLAHEMGHCMTDSFYLGCSPLELRSKHEYRANKWATDYLIPFSMLCEAVKNGCRELWQLAEYFDVSSAFIEKAIQIHATRGYTVPTNYYNDI